MFVRSKSTPNSPRKSIQVVETYRERKTGKVKQRIVRYIGIAMNDEEEAKLKQMAYESIATLTLEQEAISAQLSLLEPLSGAELVRMLSARNKLGRRPKKKLEDVVPVDQVTLDSIIEESRIIDGVHEVAGHLYDSLGYDQLLPSAKQRDILKDLVLCRIARPSSKMATCNSLKRYYAKEHDLDTLYRTLDKLYTQIDAMQQCTFAATSRLVPNSAQIILFDVTTLHFESTEVDTLRQFGYSKNCRFNTTQVVLALATTKDGLPIGYELFAGSKAEVKTLLETIDQWKQLFAIQQVCFIGDRAMMSEDNLKALEDRGYHYIVAAKLHSLPEVMQQKFLQLANQESDAPVEAQASDMLRIGTFRYEEADIAYLQERGAKPPSIAHYRELISNNAKRRIVVSHSAKREHHDHKQRSVMVEKIEKQLARTQQSAKLITNAALQKYTSARGKSESYLDADKVAADADWDGLHGVITNIPETEESAGSAQLVLEQYRKLVKIEDCFRVNKSTLKMRPIYHWKPERIRAHVALCYMAFAIVRQLEYRVKLIKKLSINALIEELNGVQSPDFPNLQPQKPHNHMIYPYLIDYRYYIICYLV